MGLFPHLCDSGKSCCLPCLRCLHVVWPDPVARCQRSATFLPEVAKHERWSCQDTIDALIAKAGYVGSITHQLREALAITRYQSTACSLSYDDYCSLRQPLAGNLPSANGVPITVPA